jgi:hypothetical protein
LQREHSRYCILQHDPGKSKQTPLYPRQQDDLRLLKSVSQQDTFIWGMQKACKYDGYREIPDLGTQDASLAASKTAINIIGTSGSLERRQAR